MSLYMDRSGGVDDTSGMNDLFTISWDDGNLGQGSDTILSGSGGIPTILAAPVSYAPSVSTGKASANRLFLLVNAGSTANWTYPILVTPLSGGNDPYSGLPIDGDAFTYVDSFASPPVIHVVYDTSQNNGAGMAAFDTSGNAIQSPNAVILYHELSHAYHHAINQHPFPQSSCAGNTTDEPAAAIDENVLRSQLGLCQRDVCNPAMQYTWGKGCGGKATPSGPAIVDNVKPPTTTCFIVTAATGSRDAREILALRKLRDRLAAQSAIAGDLIEAIYVEYATFAPGIASSIARDSAARAAVLQTIVRPLFAWYDLASRLALAPGDRDGIDAGIDAAFEACPSQLAPFVIPLLQRLGGGDSRPEAPFDLEPVFEKMSSLPRAAWALFEPLLAIWTGGSDQAGASDAAGAFSPQDALWTRPPEQGGLTRAVAAWLAAAPVETLAPPRADAADRDLAALARLFDFAPDDRLRLGARLRQSWPDLSSALRRHGFVEPD